MSLDNVTVNMSRLALARAIKTPDGDDTEADPWTKSVIFHQSHIPQAIEQHNGQRRSHGHQTARPQHPHRPHHGRVPQQRHSSSPAQRLHSQAQAQAPIPAQSQTSAPSPAARIRKTYIPSDDEDDEDEEEEESSESEEEDGEKSPLPVRQVKPSTPVQSTDEDDQKSKNKATRKQPLPSDDESSAEENDEEYDEDEDNSSVEITPQRHSDPQSLLKGSRASFLGSSKDGGFLATHHRSRSLGDMMETQSSGLRLHRDSVPSPPIEQWRRSADPYGRTPETYDSQHMAAVYQHRRSKSSERLDKLPMGKPSTPVPGRSNRRKSAMLDYEGMQSQMMQYQQAQQLSHIQQYQTAQSKNRKSQANRASMSGMDMLLQLEHEKQQLLKNKSKKLDSTNAPIEGLLAKLPETGAYNVNFQQLQGSKSHGTRSSGVKAENTRDSYKHQSMGRPNSVMGYLDTRTATPNSLSPDYRRSRLSAWMDTPYPTSSVSTPATHLQRQYQQQLMMMDQQQQMMQSQYLVPASMLQMPMNYVPMMPAKSPEAVMRQGIPRPTSYMSKRSSSAWGAI